MRIDILTRLVDSTAADAGDIKSKRESWQR